MMKAKPTNRPPCRLESGDLRRVPQDPLYGLVGYHVCCPRCGFVTVALHGSEGLSIAEDDAGVSFSQPLRCTYCSVLLHLVQGRFEIEDDGHARPVRAR